MKKLLILSVGMLVLSCNQNTKTNAESAVTESPTKTEVAENFDWLTGKWKRLNEEAGKETFENWEKTSPSEYLGIGFTMQKNDTVSWEKMQIVESDGKWRLFVKMKEEKESTEFQISELKNNEFVFTNDSIDFPKRIHYRIEGEKMKATISNAEMEIPFEFEKIK